MSWEKGRDTVRSMISDGAIERVPASATQSQSLVAEAKRHLVSAELVADDDPSGAYALAYDGARKAFVAILATQGLRPTSSGGHLAVYDAIDAQFGASLGGVVRPYNRMRVRRNQIEYPSGSAPSMTAAEVRRDVEKVGNIIAMAEKLISTLDSFS